MAEEHIEGAVNDFFSHYPLRRFKKGQILIYGGEKPQNVFHIVSGSIRQYYLLSRLYSGVDGLQRRMAHLMGGSAQTRLLFELVIECKRFGKPQPDGSIILPVSEAEIAQRTGLARETVNREVGKLKRASVIKRRENNLVVLAPSKLNELLGDRL